MLRRFISIFFILFTLAFGSMAKADNMTIFLKSCAYGTAGGALLGLATLAVSENPSGKINNVARGASLGLYAGIGFGLYTLYGNPKTQNNEFAKQKNIMWFSAVHREQKIDGAQLNWALLSF